MPHDVDATNPQAPASTMDKPPTQEWSEERIREVVQARFKVRPCYLQIQIALALYKGHDVVAVAATGTGKTLSFWIALVMAMEDGDKDAMILVITPLNLLGSQNMNVLAAAKVPAIAVDKISLRENKGLYKRIEKGEFRVVAISPELATDVPMQETLAKKQVKDRVRYSVIDEAHCVKQWAPFRGQYLYLGMLRGIIPTMAIYIASATLPKDLRDEVADTVRLRTQTAKYFIRTNDRPTIYLECRAMEYAKSSYKDLAFLIRDNIRSDFEEGKEVVAPPKFLVFFDNKKEAEAATRYLWRRLPWALYRKVKWLHSAMSQKYREREADRLKRGETWGLMVTDAFGMGMDLPDVKIVVQWGAPDNFDTFWQRVGRAARGKGSKAIALLLTEKSNLDSEREKKAAKAAKAAAAKANPSKKVLGKRKAVDELPVKHADETGTQMTAETTSTSTLGKRKAEDDNVGEGRAGKRQARGSASNTPPMIEARDSGIGSAENAAASIMMDSQPPKPATPPTRTLTRADLGSRYRPLKARTSQSRRSGLTSRRSKQKKEMQLAVDDYINSEARGIPCLRDVPTAFYENDLTASIEDAKKCGDVDDPTAPCKRCSPNTEGPCCQGCDPEAEIRQLTIPIIFPPEKQTPGPSKVNPHPPTDCNRQLCQRLLLWRRTTGGQKFADHIIRQHGLDIFMPIDIVDRIVDCHHARKIHSVADLDVETEWSRAEEYGEEILALLQEFTPSPVKALSAPVADTGVNAVKQRKTVCCSMCGVEGHNKRTCPNKYKVGTQSENIRPPTPPPANPTPPVSPMRGHRFQQGASNEASPLPIHRHIFFEPTV